MILNILGFLWCLPNTILGLLAGILSFALPRGDWIIESNKGFIWLLHKLGYEGISIGYTILYYPLPKFPHILYDDYLHELVHRQQQKVWGIFFFFAYIVAGFMAIWGGKHFYFDNYFEIQAYGGLCK